MAGSKTQPSKTQPSKTRRSSLRPSRAPAPPPSAVPEPLPPPPPAPPASAPPLQRGEAAPVKLGDSVVFSLYAARGDRPPEQRARAATKALSGIIEGAKGEDVRVTRQGDVAVVMVGQTPIVQLGETDAQIAGDSSLDVHAANVAAQLRRAIDTERQRSAIANLVFSISLVVFFALIAIYLMRKLGDIAERARIWLEERGEKGLTVRIRDIEVLSPATIQSTASIAVGLGKWLGQFGILYSWLVVVLSLFDATRGYTQRLTGFVLEPLSQMMTRFATSLPLLVILTIAGLAVFVVVRFVRLFFRSVERRETVVPWMPAELAGRGQRGDSGRHRAPRVDARRTGRDGGRSGRALAGQRGRARGAGPRCRAAARQRAHRNLRGLRSPLARRAARRDRRAFGAHRRARLDGGPTRRVGPW